MPLPIILDEVKVQLKNDLLKANEEDVIVEKKPEEESKEGEAKEEEKQEPEKR